MQKVQLAKCGAGKMCNMKCVWHEKCNVKSVKCEEKKKTVKKRSTVERVRQGTGKKWGSKPEKV